MHEHARAQRLFGISARRWCQKCGDRWHATVQPGLSHRAEFPAAGGAKRDAPGSGAPRLSSHQQQPGREQGLGIGALRIRKERGIDRAGGVVEG